MNVTEAVQSRRSVRAFFDTPVDRSVLQRVLETARRSPSGGNTQPWHAEILTGEPMQALFASVAEVLPHGKDGFSPEYDIYPKDLSGDYETRRRGVGEDMYGALDIARDNKMGRRMWFANNFRAFGAPVLMLVHTKKYMGPPQWSDIGMWLQTIMLLLRQEGLDSCAQEAWAMYSRQIRAAVPIPDDHIFFCGMAIGYRDPDAAVNRFDVARAELTETVDWHGWR
ncbi:MAG: nitroreductase [Pontixanthobacter sp.]